MSYNKAKWDFHLIAFSQSNNYEEAMEEWYLKDKYTRPYADNGAKYQQKMKDPESKDCDFKCICGTPIRYRYKIHNRNTGKSIPNIGSCCIKKYMPQDYKKIEQANYNESQRKKRIVSPEKFCSNCLVAHRRSVGTRLCTRCEENMYVNIDWELWRYYRM